MKKVIWNWFYPGGNYKAILLDHNGEEVCDFGHSETYYPTEGTEPDEYNKLIIAAAPEMLQMLEIIINSEHLSKYNYNEIEKLINKATIKYE